MSRATPYLQRRGHTFSFRIDVPLALRAVVGLREIIRALKTEERSKATPLALEMGATAKRLFSELRTSMNNKFQMLQLLQDAKRKLEIDALKESHEEELNEVHGQRIQEVKTALLEGENRALRRPVDTNLAAAPPAVHVALSPTAPASIPFKKVVAMFLASPTEQKSPAMLKKHQTVLPLLLDVVGRERAIDNPAGRHEGGFGSREVTRCATWRCRTA